MKYFTFLILFFYSLPVFAEVIVKDSSLYSDSRIIGQVKKETKVKILEATDKQYKVEIKNRELSVTGFIDKDSIENITKETNVLSFWSDRAWQRITNPENNLPWLNPEMDKEYRLDILNYSYPDSWNDRWNNTDNGIRFSFGSISKKHLFNIGEVKTSIPLDDENSLKFKYSREESLEAKRDYLEFSFLNERFFNTGLYSFFVINPCFEKPDIDFEIGLGKKEGIYNIQISLGFLDLYNNLTYRLSEEVEREIYNKKSYVFKFKTECFLSKNTGFQVFGALTTTSQKAYLFQDEADNFTSRYKAGYFGFSYSCFNDNTMLAPYITYQYEKTVNDLKEELINLGIKFNKKISEKYKVETNIKYIIAKQNKDNYNYNDKDLLGQVVLLQEYSKNISFNYGLLFSFRDTDFHPDFDFQGNNYRLILGLEYRYTENTYANIGISFDLDRNDNESIYDGGKLQIISEW